jgi:CheY-like chemotaxis protein
MTETNTPAPLGLLLSDDLIFISRVAGTASAQGLNLKSARSAAALVTLARQQRPRCVIVDLANPGLILPALLQELAEVCAPLPRVVAYGSHVDTETLRAARAAGCDPVWPRSKFVEDLATVLPEWFEHPQ